MVQLLAVLSRFLVVTGKIVDSSGACRRKTFPNQESMTYGDAFACKLLILRLRKSISDRLSGCPSFLFPGSLSPPPHPSWRTALSYLPPENGSDRLSRGGLTSTLQQIPITVLQGFSVATPHRDLGPLPFCRRHEWRCRLPRSARACWRVRRKFYSEFLQILARLQLQP
jgi:hypothetical protein